MLVHYSTYTMHDFELEEHTIVVDNLDHTNKTDFTAHLPMAIEHVVEARLIAATINTSGDTQRVLHVNIDELRTTFSQRTKADLESGSDNHLNGLFGTILCQHVLHAASGSQKAVFFRDEYPISRRFYTPIQKLDRLTFNIDRENGDSASLTDAIFVFKFMCKRRSLA